MKKYLFVIFSVCFGAIILGQTDLQYKMDSVVVSAYRIPLSSKLVGRNVEIISQDEIQLLPATDIQSILDNFSGLDIKQRGPEGVQADISIRGGSFEQTLILIDGIRLSDPQTGHHNLNLPIPISQIERIEIVKGQGSRVYGANAFSGVINIIPKDEKINRLSINASGGENSYYELGLGGSYKLGKTNHNLSLSRTKSDGYRHNTEFDNYNLSMNNSFIFSKSVIKTFLGYTTKDFGANSYYTIRFPEQSEQTKTLLASASAEIKFEDFTIYPKIYWRNNRDEFLLIKNNPSFYKNNHETDVYGGEFQASTDALGGATSFGIEFTQDNIESNNLGTHKRITKGFFVEQIVPFTDNLNFSIGGFAYYYSQVDWKFWPGIDVAYNLGDNFKLFANYGRAFRIPTYTELFYSDPVTQGNADLKPEESDNYEIGFNYSTEMVNFRGSYFIKDGKNLIDYVLDNETEIWNAQNFTEIKTQGFELGMLINLSKYTNNMIKRLAIDYTYLDSDKAEFDLMSRYVLENLEHDLTLNLFHSLPLGIINSWSFNYEDRITLGDHFTIDTKLSKNFSNFNVFLKASNLLNKSYEEIPGVPLPGRWIIGGIELDLL